MEANWKKYGIIAAGVVGAAILATDITAVTTAVAASRRADRAVERATRAMELATRKPVTVSRPAPKAKPQAIIVSCPEPEPVRPVAVEVRRLEPAVETVGEIKQVTPTRGGYILVTQDADGRMSMFSVSK